MHETIRAWLAAEAAAREASAKANELFDHAKEHADPVGALRKATASDIREGALIWYVDEDGGEPRYWQIVGEVLRPRDPWKAYCSTDGCRYGLEGAMVEVSNANVTGLAPTQETTK